VAIVLFISIFAFGYIVFVFYPDKVFNDLSAEATQGDASAQYMLGKRYYDGEGVGRDYEKAVEWWTKAAEQGNAEAQFWLGLCCQYSYGVEQDYEKAIYLIFRTL
jgi:TPR repeat protein